MFLTIHDLLKIEYVHIQNIGDLQEKTIRGVSTDSRTVQRGDIFVAIRGEKFDGHQFLNEAFEKGTVAAIVHEQWMSYGSTYSNNVLIRVKDTVKALGQLANVYRGKFDVPVITVTGTNGKTTTKEMIASILSARYSVLKTEGNLNNQIGVPQTLFRLQKEHEVAVIEMGTNHFGEIAYLCKVAEPTHGLITNVGHAHLEFFENIEGVAKAKGELFESLESSGFGFVNADDKFIVEKAKVLKKKMTYGFQAKRSELKGKFLGLNEQAQPRFSFDGVRLKKPLEIELRIAGTHNIFNGLAAAAVGLEFEISSKKIKNALENFNASSNRMEVSTLGGVTIINDTYNSNPDSVAAALSTLSAMKCSGKKIVVLGDMLELGDKSQQAHKGIGNHLAERGFQYVLTFGAYSRFIAETSNAKHSKHFEDKNLLTEQLIRLVKPGDIVLVKGSRRMKMEEVVEQFTEYLQKLM